MNQHTTAIVINDISWRYYAVNVDWDVVICVIMWWFSFVETKGRALEEVDELFDGVVHADGIFIGDGRNVVSKGMEMGTVEESVTVSRKKSQIEV